MSSTEYLVWILAMAILIPVIVHGGITWAYFRGKQVPSRPAGDAPASYRPLPDDARLRAREPGTTHALAAIENDEGVPAKQIWRWQDDGGAIR